MQLNYIGSTKPQAKHETYLSTWWWEYWMLCGAMYAISDCLVYSVYWTNIHHLSRCQMAYSHYPYHIVVGLIQGYEQTSHVVYTTVFIRSSLVKEGTIAAIKDISTWDTDICKMIRKEFKKSISHMLRTVCRALILCVVTMIWLMVLMSTTTEGRILI